MMQAAGKNGSDSFVEKTPFGEVMSIWTRWMALDDKQHSSGDSHPQDVKELMRCGEAVEVMVNNLPRRLWWAIRKSRGITTVWMFPNQPLHEAIIEAEEILLPKMKNHIATRRYFD